MVIAGRRIRLWILRLVYVATAVAVHPGCPQWHASSTTSFAPSHAALQYFSPSGATQLHTE
ncbi:MAG TPA: hypothetical protein VE178_06625 [Silvibacterium sp.]|nr:hypothetical protein [Silvibacterium sp.]